MTDQSESVCIDCGQPLRGEVLRECANPACPMYGGEADRKTLMCDTDGDTIGEAHVRTGVTIEELGDAADLEERSRDAAKDTDRRDGREFGEGPL